MNVDFNFGHFHFGFGLGIRLYFDVTCRIVIFEAILGPLQVCADWFGYGEGFCVSAALLGFGPHLALDYAKDDPR